LCGPGGGGGGGEIFGPALGAAGGSVLFSFFTDASDPQPATQAVNNRAASNRFSILSLLGKNSQRIQ
jgi:hypothetical protein